MVNGKSRQRESIIATDFSSRNHPSLYTAPTTKCLTSMSKSTTITTTTTTGQTALLPHRKVFMITEKSGENDKQHGVGSTDATNGGRKRKMILIMDEKPQTDKIQQRSNGIKHMKIENDHNAAKSTASTSTSAAINGANNTPKLLFFANSVDDQLSQKIEEILPEILSRIQWKNGRFLDGNESGNSSKQQLDRHLDNGNGNNNDNANNKLTTIYKTEQRVQELLHEEYSNGSNSELTTNSHHNNNSNLMLLGAAAAAKAACHNAESMRRITLPPKKNHSKFQRQLNNNHNNNGGGEQIISAATPVIVTATSLNKTKNNQVSAIKTSSDQQNKCINNINHHHQQQQQQINRNNQFIDNSQHQQNHQDYQQTHKSKQDNQYHHNYSHENNINNKIAPSNIEKSSIVVQQQNINLTGDFLFLMKMLPILEKTPEPRKTQVKMLIEKIMKQCVSDDSPE